MPHRVPVVPSLAYLEETHDSCACRDPIEMYPGPGYVTEDGRAYRAVLCRRCGGVAGWRHVRTDTALIFSAAVQKCLSHLDECTEMERAQIRGAVARLLEVLASQDQSPGDSTQQGSKT